jgi:hypothetical protein
MSAFSRATSAGVRQMRLEYSTATLRLMPARLESR